VRYLLASDLHYRLPQLDWIAEQATDFDAVVLAGDHLDLAGHADLAAQIVMVRRFLEQLAESTTVIANSGNHDLSVRGEHGEKVAHWLTDLDPAIVQDGHTARIGGDLVSSCAWWEGPVTQAEVRDQLERDAARRPADGDWIWVYHSPPDASPTSWSGSRHFGDEVLNELIAQHSPTIVLTGHVHDAPMRSDGSWRDRIGDTWVINAGRQTGPVPAHAIIDTGAATASWWTFGDAEDDFDLAIAG
jgi:Icc-related predicted phosphoesterase